MPESWASLVSSLVETTTVRPKVGSTSPTSCRTCASDRISSEVWADLRTCQDLSGPLSTSLSAGYVSASLGDFS